MNDQTGRQAVGIPGRESNVRLRISLAKIGRPFLSQNLNLVNFRPNVGLVLALTSISQVVEIAQSTHFNYIHEVYESHQTAYCFRPRYMVLCYSVCHTLRLKESDS